jgi:sialic acid synthase SpsE
MDLKNLVVAIRKVEKAIIGDEDKKILKIEEGVAKKLREHIKI